MPRGQSDMAGEGDGPTWLGAINAKLLSGNLLGRQSEEPVRVSELQHEMKLVF